VLLKLIQQRFPLITLVFLYFISSVLSYKQYGLTNDEPEEYFLGKLLYIKLKANDPVLEKSFVINDGKSNLFAYDRIYPAFLYSLNQKESYEIYHLLNLLTATIAIVAAYELLLFQTKNSFLALIGPITLLLIPRFSGDLAANPKDAPLAISYLVSLSLIVLLKKQNTPLSLLILGFSFGLTQSLRIIGYSIYLVYFLYNLLSKQKFPKPSWLIDLASQTLVIFLLGFLVHLVTLPYLGADPLGNFINLIKSSTQFPWDSQVLFNGQLLSANNLPWFYLPVWILITTPIFIILLCGYSLTLIKKTNPVIKLFWLALVVNLTIFFIVKPVVYDGLRHMLFLLPIMAILASFGLIDLIKKKRRVAIGLILFNIILVIVSVLRLFPYQYTYFNELVSAPPWRGAHSFELDYWGASYKQLITWLNKHPEHTTNKTIFFCGDPAQLSSVAQFELNLAKTPEDADLLICHHRAGNDRVFALFPTQIRAVNKLGLPLSEVRKK